MGIAVPVYSGQKCAYQRSAGTADTRTHVWVARVEGISLPQDDFDFQRLNVESQLLGIVGAL